MPRAVRHDAPLLTVAGHLRHSPTGHMGNCQNYGPFLGPYYNTGPNTGPNLGYPKRDHNFDNQPYGIEAEMVMPQSRFECVVRCATKFLALNPKPS